MKKLLFFIPSLGQGGAEKVLVNLVNNMDSSKFDITVQTLFAGGVNEQFLKSNIKYKSCYKRTFRGNSKYFCLYSPKTLYNRFIKEHYDIIVSYLEGPTARIVSGCTDKNTKLVSWIHCKMDTEESASVGFKNFNEAKECYNKFHKTVCVSQWVKDYFVKTFNFNKPIEVLYNTIETDVILEKSAEAVEDITFSDKYFNICSVGKLTKVKGFERLAKIHKRLLGEGINNRLYILGIGEEKENLKKYIEDNSLENTLILLGYKTNPYKYVKKCDLYVCSSYSEGFSTSVTESLIVGTPVVTTLCSGMTELLGENNEYGIVTENDEDALYEGIKTILTTPNMLEDYSKRAFERGKNFSTEKTVKAVEEMLYSL
jgi:glycosyltransferase involved in cell wall biosynthesis